MNTKKIRSANGLLRRDQLYIVSKEKISLPDLPSLSAISYDTDISLKSIIDQWWKNQYQKPQKISMHTDRSDTCYEMVLSGLGYAILPEICLKNEELHFMPLLDQQNEPIYRDTWLVYSDHVQKLKQVSMFIKHMVN